MLKSSLGGRQVAEEQILEVKCSLYSEMGFQILHHFHLNYLESLS